MYHARKLPGVTAIFITSYIPGDDFSPASPQYKWLEATLRAVDRAVTPWVIVTMHSPWYSSYVGEREREREKERGGGDRAVDRFTRTIFACWFCAPAAAVADDARARAQLDDCTTKRQRRTANNHKTTNIKHTKQGHYKENDAMRQKYEPLFYRYAVDAVVAGHV
jgi:UDP-2,3-diacylglucosamine pyrophosphatase LpxH